jgi:GNAT superfamily N-acetyltransferase
MDKKPHICRCYCFYFFGQSLSRSLSKLYIKLWLGSPTPVSNHRQQCIDNLSSDLGTLVTSPDHQRRGAGTKLIQWGIARARALNLPIYLSASPSGLPLYTKLGFKTCGSLGIDGSFFTPPHNLPVRDSICMLLPAPSPDLPPSLPYASTNKTQFPVQILPTTDHADFPFITDISSRAYADNEYIALAFPPGPDPAASRAFTIRSHILNLTADPSNMYHKAVDPFTGLIVGFSYWHFYDDLTREHIAFAGGMPLNANVPLLDVSYERTSKMREEFFSNPPRKWAYCANLCVDPEWHRRGVGKALLEEVLKEVDRQGLEAWLEASDKGKGLYEKLGWKVEMTFDADLSPWGGPKVQRIWCMLRKPRVEGEKSG